MSGGTHVAALLPRSPPSRVPRPASRAPHLKCAGFLAYTRLMLLTPLATPRATKALSSHRSRLLAFRILSHPPSSPFAIHRTSRTSTSYAHASLHQHAHGPYAHLPLIDPTRILSCFLPTQTRTASTRILHLVLYLFFAYIPGSVHAAAHRSPFVVPHSRWLPAAQPLSWIFFLAHAVAPLLSVAGAPRPSCRPPFLLALYLSRPRGCAATSIVPVFATVGRATRRVGGRCRPSTVDLRPSFDSLRLSLSLVSSNHIRTMSSGPGAPSYDKGDAWSIAGGSRRTERPRPAACVARRRV